VCGIYLIYCLANDHFYIGQTLRFNKRKVHHLCKLKANKHTNTRLQNCFNKYGESSLTFEIVKECPSEWLDRFEQLWIDTYIENPKCMNICKEAVSFARGLIRSQEIRQKLSECKKGANNPHYGKHHTEEHKNKIALAGKGRIVTEETRQKIREFHTGKCRAPFSEEWKANIGKSVQGRVVSEETKSKLSKARLGENNPFFGKQHTEENRAASSKRMMGENNPNFGRRGRIVSEETRRKLSEAGLRRYAKVPLTSGY